MFPIPFWPYFEEWQYPDPKDSGIHADLGISVLFRYQITVEGRAKFNV